MMKRILLVLWLATLSAFGAAVVTPAGQGTNNGFWYGQAFTPPNVTAPPWTNPIPAWNHPSLGTHAWSFYDKLDSSRIRTRGLMTVRESVSDPSTRALYLGDATMDGFGFEGFNGLALQVIDSASGNTDPRIAMVFGDTYGFRFRETNMVTYGGGVHDVELFFFDSLNHNDVVVGPREPRGALAERGGTLLIRGTNIFFTNNIAGTVPVRIFNNGDVRVLGLAGVGTRHVGADADGDLVIVSDGGGAWTGDPNQFSAPAAGTNIIVGALLTNIVVYRAIGSDSLSADFGSPRTLYDDNDDPAVAWSIGVLRAQNVESIDWSGRFLKDGTGTEAANWHTRTLFDSTGTAQSVDWNTRKLYKSDGMTEALDWDASVSIIGGKVFIDDDGLTRITNALIIHSNGVPHDTNYFQVATATNRNSFSVNTVGDVYNRKRYIATNETAANLITVISNSMIYLTNGVGNWATLGYNSTNSGTNVSPYFATISQDMNPGTVTAGFRRDDTFGQNSVVFENPAGTIQSHLRANRILSGDRLQTYAGLWLGTNATEELIISGKDSGTPNRHWANYVVITNGFIAGTNNLDGPGSTPTSAWGTNQHLFAVPDNARVWSISAAGTPTGEIYHWVPTIMKSSLIVGSNAPGVSIHSTNIAQISSDDNRTAFEVNKVIGKAFFGVPTTFQGVVTNNGQVIAQPGSVSAPSYAFTTAPSSGFYRASGPVIVTAVNGAGYFSVGSSLVAIRDSTILTFAPDAVAGTGANPSIRGTATGLEMNNQTTGSYTNLALRNLRASHGVSSYATNYFANLPTSGFTNSTVAPGVGGTNNMVARVIGTSGSLEFYNRSDAGGQTVCGVGVFTNTLSSSTWHIPVPVNSGFIIRSPVGVEIQCYAQ